MHVIPTIWSEAILSNTGHIVTGTTPPKDSPQNYGGNIPFVKPPDLKGSVVYTASEYISETGRQLARIVPANSVLVSCIGVIGKTGITSQETAINQQLNAVTCRETIEPKYLLYYLQSTIAQEWLAGHASATTVSIINKSKFGQLPVPFPDRGIQHAIVEAIETQFTRLDAAVAALKRIQANLRRYRAAVLKAACSGQLVPTEAALAQQAGRAYEPASALLERILAERRTRWQAEHPGKRYQEPAAPDTSALPELPEGWCWATVEQVAENLDYLRRPVNRKERAEREGDIPYYGANGQVGWIDDFLFDEPLVLVVEDETFIGREKPFSYRIEGKTWVNNHAHVLRARGVSTAYLNYSLAYYPFTPLTTGTTGRKKLTQQALSMAPYALPPWNEQSRIVDEIERRLSGWEVVLQSTNADLLRADRLRQSILQQAFSGQLVQPAAPAPMEHGRELAGPELPTLMHT